MLKKTAFLPIIVLLLLITGSAALAQMPTPHVTALPLPGGTSLQQVAPALTSDICQRLSGRQRTLCEEEFRKNGGRMTPEALEALKSRPEFQGLSAETGKGKPLTDEKATPAAPAPKKAAADEPARTKSLFDRARTVGKYQDISTDLKPFGFDFFDSAAVKVVTERRDMPVPLKYVVGPGDEVKLLLWGRVNSQYTLTVDRDGKITIPQIGPLFVAGMTFEEMSKQVIKQSEQIVGTNVDISMGSLKTIQIFVLGDVQRPGAYTIGSFATITDALLLAGGPTEIGSMRNVQLKRKGKVVTHFDLYDLLLKGDKSRDLNLMAGDVVFVPVTGPLVGVAGNVKRPAIYELRDQHDLHSLLDLAGGIIPTADTQQIQVERIVKNDRQVVLDINDKTLAKASSTTLQDADLVKVFNIVEQNINVVYLNGNVKKPGKYEIKPGMRLGDLLSNPEKDLLPETHFDYALIKRQKPPGLEVTLVPFHLGRLILEKNPAENIELAPRDQIFIFNRWYFRDKPYVSIEGEIRGECPTATADRENGNAKDAPAMTSHGSKRDTAFFSTTSEKVREDSTALGEKQTAAATKRVDIAPMVQDLKTMEETLRKQGQFGLANVIRDILEEARTMQRLQADDLRALRAELSKAGQHAQADTIQDMENRLKNICQIPLMENMRVRDAILATGGLTADSSTGNGEIIRREDNKTYKTYYFDVAKAMKGDTESNIALKKEDRIIIHSIWETVFKKNVAIDGEVARPGTYQFTEGMTVRDLVFKGGNILESAYIDEAEVSSLVFDERKHTRTERRSINLRRALEGDPSQNLVLKPYDRLLVKRIPDWSTLRYVTLSGDFRFPGRYAVAKGEKLSSVIERAGGYMPTAYLRGAYFTRERVKALQQKSLDEMARRMERELLSEGSARIASSVTADERLAKTGEMEAKRKLIESMRELKATGRMTIALTHLRMLKNSTYDIDLEDGDTLFLPPKNSVVNVVGSVMSEGSHIYDDRLSYEDYIAMTGGYSRFADTSNVFVVKADGSARKLSTGFASWSDRRGRWELAAFGQEVKTIEPGDIIVVPEKISTIAWLREIRDFTQIMMNTVVAAGVVIKLF